MSYAGNNKFSNKFWPVARAERTFAPGTYIFHMRLPTTNEQESYGHSTDGFITAVRLSKSKPANLRFAEYRFSIDERSQLVIEPYATQRRRDGVSEDNPRHNGLLVDHQRRIRPTERVTEEEALDIIPLIRQQQEALLNAYADMSDGITPPYSFKKEEIPTRRGDRRRAMIEAVTPEEPSISEAVIIKQAAEEEEAARRAKEEAEKRPKKRPESKLETIIQRRKDRDSKREQRLIKQAALGTDEPAKARPFADALSPLAATYADEVRYPKAGTRGR